MKRLVCKLMASAMALFVLASQAQAVELYGVKIGADPLSKLHGQYDLMEASADPLSGDRVFYVSPSQLKTPDLISARFLVDKQRTISGVILSFDTDNFDYFDEMFAKAYYVKEKSTPLDGNQHVVFYDEDVVINLLFTPDTGETTLQITTLDVALRAMETIAAQRGAAR